MQIYSPPDSVYPTGSIYGLRRSQLAADLEDRWFLVQIFVEGQRCLVRVDGETVAETDARPAEALAPGRVGLQIHCGHASAEFRDLRLRPIAHK